MTTIRLEKWAERIVNRLARKLPNGSYDKRDLISAAYVGLLEAQERFDKTQGIPFERFAYLRVRGAVLDQIRKDCFLSVSSGKYAKLYAKSQEQQNFLTEDEVSKVQTCAKLNALAFRVEFQEEISAKNTAIPEIEENIDRQRILKKFSEVYQELSKVEKKIIDKYYLNGETFDEIAKNQGVTKSAVWKNHKKLISKLRNLLGIETWLSDSLYSN
ncbi:MAG: sigma-70 family RNA polymerase sigma factor [Bdellovibrionales bacterium]|nr:sigma-70 family RNA polymerase sigma factor [Bdellovibrionales bacterium]